MAATPPMTSSADSDSGVGSGETDGPDAADAAPRRATVADLPSIRRLISAAYSRYADRMEHPPAPVLNDYEAEAVAGVIWVIGTPITGVIVLIDQPGSLLIENVAVDPPVQGSGLGRRLMSFAEQQAAARGLRRLTLYTNEVMVENLAIYASLGYRETGRWRHGGYRRVFMEKILAPAGPA
jgi:GNAT superfamily N-acetyltransferase